MSLLWRAGSALRAVRFVRPQVSARIPFRPARILAAPTLRLQPFSRGFANPEEADLDPLELSMDERSHRKGRKESELAEKRKKQKQEMFVKRALENAVTKEQVRLEAERQGFKDITAVPQNVLADILKSIDKKKDIKKRGLVRAAVSSDDDDFDGVGIPEDIATTAARKSAGRDAQLLQQQQAAMAALSSKRSSLDDEDDDDDEEDEEGDAAMEAEEIMEEISTPENVRLAEQYLLPDMNRHYPDFSEPYNVPKPTNAEERRRRDTAEEVYTSQITPSAHSAADAGKYYELPESLSQALPASMFVCVKEEFQLISKLIMVRDVGLKVNSVLKQIQELSAAPNVNRSLALSLHGSRFAGKSTQLLYTANYALENGWLVLPTNARGVAEDIGVISRNPQDKSLWDQPKLAQGWFQTLLAGQADTLKKVKLQTAAAKALANGGSDLHAVAEAAAQSPEAAAAAVQPFFAEAKATNDVPVLAILDNVNQLALPSSFFDPETKFNHIPGRRLTLLAAFDDLIKTPPVWGATLFAYSSSQNLKTFKKTQELADQTFEVPRYTLRELASAAQHYHIHNYLIRGVSDVVVGKLVALSGGLPGELRQVIRGV